MTFSEKGALKNAPGAAIVVRQNSKTEFRKTALAVAITASLASVGYTQEVEQTNQEDIDTVNVYGERTSELSSLKFSRSLLDTAQTVNVISSELIEERSATTLRDVLRNVSGISMQAGEGGTPAGDQLSIRGFSARTDIFVDNVRDFGGYTRDPFNLEQVEVVKGPSSDYSGRGSTGGSINLVSKSPSLTDSTSVDLGVGTDEYTRVAIDTNKSLENIDGAAVRLNLLYHDQDIAGRDYVENNRWGIAPSIAFGLGSDTQATFSFFHMKQDNVPDYGIPWVPSSNTLLADYADSAPPVDYSNWYGLLDRDFEETSTSMATIQLDNKINEIARVSNVTRWGTTERDSMITAPRFESDDSTNIRRSDEKYRDQTDDIISNQTYLSLDINSGQNWEHKIVTGMEFSLEGEKRYTQELTGSDSPSTDLYDPDPTDEYLENYQRTGGYSDADSKTFALYLSDSVQVNDKWQLNGGVRWEEFNLEYTPDGSDTLERTDRMFSYRASLVYKPSREGSIYLGYGTSFNPTAEALSISTSSRTPGIADLDPEENRTVELGTKWEVFNRRMLATAALFRTEKTNARTEDPDDPNDLLVLEGEQLVQGLELGLAGNITDSIGVFAGYTYLETEITESEDVTEIGNSLANSPEHTFNLWSTYQVNNKVRLGLGAQYVDERYSSTDNNRSAPDYWLWEASADYAYSNDLSFRINIQNLTDEEYIDYLAGGHFVPGTARVAMLSLSYDF